MRSYERRDYTVEPSRRPPTCTRTLERAVRGAIISRTVPRLLSTTRGAHATTDRRSGSCSERGNDRDRLLRQGADADGKTDAFEDGGIIPERYAGRGGNVRPGFTFSNIPAGTVSFAIVLQDLDVAANGADGVLHWLAWNIPAKAGGIPEGSLPEGAVVRNRRSRPRNLFRTWRSRRSPVPSLRFRTLRAECDAGPARRRDARPAARRDEGHHRRQVRVFRPIPSIAHHVASRRDDARVLLRRTRACRVRHAARRSASICRSSTRLIFPEIVFGSVANSIRRIRL